MGIYTPARYPTFCTKKSIDPTWLDRTIRENNRERAGSITGVKMPLLALLGLVHVGAVNGESHYPEQRKRYTRFHHCMREQREVTGEQDICVQWTR